MWLQGRVWDVSINETKICNMHTKEKEKSGTCCHAKEDQEIAEQLTYEQSFVTIIPKEQNE